MADSFRRLWEGPKWRLALAIVLAAFVPLSIAIFAFTGWDAYLLWTLTLGTVLWFFFWMLFLRGDWPRP